MYNPMTFLLLVFQAAVVELFPMFALSHHLDVKLLKNRS